MVSGAHAPGQSADLTLPTPRRRGPAAQAGLQKYPVDRAPGTLMETWFVEPL
jgi:hypothetical protein